MALPLALLLPAAGGSARPAPPQPNRPLLTYVAADRGLCLVRADGTHPMRLTPRWKGLGTPAWSPHGRYVAFKRLTGTAAGHVSTSKIAVADARGRVHWSFGAWDRNGSPIWSPDGRHVAYRGTALNGLGGLDVVSPDGSDDHRVVECHDDPCPSPTWSADGRRLAFVDRAGPSGPLSIFSTRADGSDRRLLVNDAQQPAYSPMGSRLAFTAPDGSRSTWGLYVASGDGSNPRELAPPSGEGISWPTWSPDGTRLAFVRRLPCTGSPCDGQIVVVRADGTGEPTVVASDVSLDTYIRTGLIAWSPGGKLIAFVRDASLVVASADGRSERVVVSRVGNIAFTSDGVSSGVWRAAVALPAAKRRACPRR